MSRYRQPRVFVIAAAISILVAGCNIQFENPTPTTFSLGIPYVAQTGSDYCGAASTLMWAQYRGSNGATQDQIYQFMGGVGSGVSPEAIANAVMNFAHENAAVDSTTGIGDPDTLVQQFFSRQIGAINNRAPVVAIVAQGFHAGVIDGGSNHQDQNTGYYVWDTVLFNDPNPSIGRDASYSAGTWMSNMCGNGAACLQIVDPGTTGSWYSNWSSYGDDVAVRGGSNYTHGPYEY